MDSSDSLRYSLSMTTPLEAIFRISLSPIIAVLTASDSIHALLGFNADDFMSGKISLQSRIHAHDQDIADELFSVETSPAGSRTCNFRLRHADGRIRCIKGLYSKASTHGTVILELLLQDAKSLWQPSNHQSTQHSIMTNFKAMMDNTDDYIYFKDRNHVFNGASQALVEITESTQHWSEFLGLTDYDVFLETYADIYYSLEKQVFAGVNVAHDIQETRLQDGSKGWVNNRKYPIKNDAGEIIGLFGIARDITESQLTEENLRKSQAQLQALLKNLPDLVWMKNPEGVYQACNKRFEQFFGQTESHIIGKTDYDFVDREAADGFRKYDCIAMGKEGISINEEWVTFANDGHQELLETSKTPIYDEQGNIAGVLGIGHNITNRFYLTNELRKKESYQRTLLDNFPFAAWLKDTDSRFLSFNRVFVRLFGLSDFNDLTGKTDFDLTAHDLATSYRADDLKVMNSGLPQRIEEEILTEGSRKWFETYKAPLIDANGAILGTLGFARDITDMKQIEQQRLADEAANRDTLVREVHHRIKNNLQGVAGLLRNTAAQHPALAAPLAAAISQVHSIAVIHGLQGRNALSSILLCDLINEIAANHQALWKTSIVVNMPSHMQHYRIIESETVPLALVLNELISNAVKHGGKESGVQIELTVMPNHVDVMMINKGKLHPNNHTADVPVAGTGLKLVASLLPKKGVKLSWLQREDYVTTTLQITAPVITLQQ